jgi:uncharacterized protein (DUF3084 family)
MSFDPFTQKSDPFFETLRSQRNVALNKNDELVKQNRDLNHEISRLTSQCRDLESTCQTLKNKVYQFEANGSNMLDDEAMDEDDVQKMCQDIAEKMSRYSKKI